MKIVALVVITAIAGTAAPNQPDFKVKVYLRDNARVSPLVRAPALDLASKMFAKIGIRLATCDGEPPANPAEPSIGIELTTDNPVDIVPSALGSAKPFEGVHIHVFYHRVRSEAVPRSVLLAHVLVHEITHMLQRTNRHSHSGIMKESWTHRDHIQMQAGPLPFTPQDVDLIHSGMASWATAPPAPSADGAKEPCGTSQGK